MGNRYFLGEDLHFFLLPFGSAREEAVQRTAAILPVTQTGRTENTIPLIFARKNSFELMRFLKRISPLVGAGVSTEWQTTMLSGTQHANGVIEVSGSTGLGHGAFKQLQDFVSLHIGRGGVPGSISSWTVTYIDKSHQNDTKVPSYDGCTAATLDRVDGCKVTYQIAGNKFCARIGRQHRSNHIMFVVDCVRGCMYQKCWDPDCRGFSSNEIIVPVECLPSHDDLAAYIQSQSTAKCSFN